MRLLRSKTLSRLLVGCIALVGLTFVLVVYFYDKPSVLSSLSIVANNANNVDNTLCPSSVYEVINDTEKLARLKEQRFIILDWSGYSKDKKEDRFIGNCFVTRNKDFLKVSDAIAITNRKQFHFRDFPKTRYLWQRWAWILDESPFHPFSGNDFSFPQLKGLFNWTMTYRMNSDVYIPYGWTVRKPKPDPIPDFIGKQPKLAVAVLSNCGSASYVHNARFKYIQELKKYADVDIFGACSGIPCKGREKEQLVGTCPQVKDYLFYLAFENSNCREYISEKTFHHGYSMGTVPVVMGAPKEDYARITPPNSVIYTSDFTSPEHLAKYLKSLTSDRSEYMKLQEWRRNFTASYRIQFIQDEPLWVSLCSALTKSKGETKSYADLAQFWTKADCEPHKKN